MVNTLYYGDNLEVLRKYVRDETVDLCYIDPPFNSKRNYNQIYNNIGSEDRAQAQAFVDTWEWDQQANAGLSEILSNPVGRFTMQTIELVKGLRRVLGEGSLLAYLISMALRVTEIHRALKTTGSFYLHCDPTASHYLKILLDSIFVPAGGEFQNELIWGYSIGGKSKTRFGRKHDDILFYTKSRDDSHTFNTVGARIARKPDSHMRVGRDLDGREYQEKTDRKSGKVYRYYLDEGKVAEDYWIDIETLNREDAERMGYPTQKPEALLERIIGTSSNHNDLVLDAYCGCGTSVSVAQRLGRRWIGIDITYQSIALILRRLEGQFGAEAAQAVALNGIPRDMDSAVALANKKDDRLRKEFEKWAVLSYSNNRAIINDKKGADAGIDGIAYFQTADGDNATVIFQVKSGGVTRSDVATLRGDMERVGASLAVLITLQEPTAPMTATAKAAGLYYHESMGRNYDRIQIVTVREIIEGRRLDIPMSLEVLRRARAVVSAEQPALFEE